LRQDSWPVHYDTEFQYSRLMKTKRLAVDPASRCSSWIENSGKLPVSPAVASAAAMVTAVEFAGAATEVPVAVKAAIAISETTVLESLVSFKPAIAISEAAVLKSLVPFKPASAFNEARAAVESAAIETRPAIIPRPVVAMEPGTRADEHSADKPAGAVIAVGRTFVGVIVIVTVGADWSRAVVAGADAHADYHSLCLRRSCGCKHANGQQSHIL